MGLTRYGAEEVSVEEARRFRAGGAGRLSGSNLQPSEGGAL
jgi:hypothetical protein